MKTVIDIKMHEQQAIGSLRGHTHMLIFIPPKNKL